MEVDHTAALPVACEARLSHGEEALFFPAISAALRPVDPGSAEEGTSKFLFQGTRPNSYSRELQRIKRLTHLGAI